MIFRVLLALSLFVWALALKQNIWMVGLTVLCMFLLYLLGSKAVLYIRSLQLLLWLFIPIIIFQGLFTPGSYIQAPVYIPLSIEGLEHASFLCLRILLMFFVALLFLRLLTLAEWIYLLSFYPRLLNYLRPFILLLENMRVKGAAILSKQRSEWLKAEKKWLHLPNFFVHSIQLMLDTGKQEANDLWQHWDAKVLIDDPQQHGLFMYKSRDIFYGILLLSGWVILWLK